MKIITKKSFLIVFVVFFLTGFSFGVKKVYAGWCCGGDDAVLANLEEDYFGPGDPCSDFNGDGYVDSSDFLVLRNNQGQFDECGGVPLQCCCQFDSGGTIDPSTCVWVSESRCTLYYEGVIVDVSYCLSPTPIPTLIPCNRLCLRNSQCQTGYCYSVTSREFRCRDQQCPTDPNCCPSLPTNTPTPTPAKKIISGYVFLDKNENGRKDGDETCFNGYVQIWADKGKTGEKMMTFNSGSWCNRYSLEVSSGSHTVEIEPLPSGYESTGWSGTDQGQPCSGMGHHASVTDAEVSFGISQIKNKPTQNLSFFAKISLFLTQKLTLFLGFFLK